MINKDRKSLRLEHWDYGSDAAYFVTICTQNRVCFFGDVVDGSMVLNDLGNNALHCWTQIPEQFPFVKLGNHVIMPNHVHGIVLIDQSKDTSNNKQKIHQGETRIDPIVDAMRNPIAPVGTRLIASPQGQQGQQDQQGPTACGPTESSNPTNPPGGITGNKNPMLHNNLSRIIRWYKGRTTFECRKINPEFTWQSRFHDHIIRDDHAFQMISAYIKNNPLNWSNDPLMH